MTYLKKMRSVMLLILVGIGLCGSLTGCVVEDGWHGHYHHY